MTHKFLLVNPPRSLTFEENGVLHRLLLADFHGKENLLKQTQSVRVSEECKACRSIVLVVDKIPENAAPVVCRVPVHAQASDRDGENLHILLHVVQGFIDEMEIYREDLLDVMALPDPKFIEIIDIDDAV